MTDEKILTDLIGVPILQKIQNSFAKMARMAAIVTDENGIALTEPSNFCDLCLNYCRKSEIGKARCEQCDKNGALMTLEGDKPVSYKCHANLIDFAAPIMLGDTMIGTFVGGQVLTEAPDEEAMRKVAREIGVNEEEFWKAAQKVQVIPEAAIKRSTEFIYEFAQIIADMAFRSYITQQLSEEAMQAAVQKSDFLANMSHEIRTPMNAVLGMAEMALRSEMSEDARTCIKQIQASGKHLLVIINDILDFSKIDSGKMEIIEDSYDPQDMISEVANLINSRIGDKQIEFIIDTPVDMPKELYGDNVRISQILINLLNNAVKFTSQGKITLKMELDPIDAENVMLKMSVMDTGNGIKADDIPKLFGSFQQVDSKRNRSVEGTGLGLAISKRLTELMQGSIGVESEYGVGSNFHFEIPQKVNEQAVDLRMPNEPLQIYSIIGNEIVKEQIHRDLDKVHLAVEELSVDQAYSFKEGSFVIVEKALGKDAINMLAQENPSCQFIVLEQYNASRDFKLDNIRVLKKPVYSILLYAALGLCEFKEVAGNSETDTFSFIAPTANVLIVDDNPVNFVVAKGLLEPLKMNIDTAVSATECIDLTKKKMYDIIFMDHMMPEVDGVETTHILRRMVPGYDKVPIIALTANAVGGAREMFLSEGMDDMIAKPIETKKIVAKVREWLPPEKIQQVDASQMENNQEEDGPDLAALSEKTGLDMASGLKMLGSSKLYFTFLREYYHDIAKKADKVQKEWEEKDIKNYTIDVHAIKSSSKQVGDMALSELARSLEEAGNQGNIDLIQEKTGKLLADYRALAERIRLAFPEWEEAQNHQQVSVEECLETLLAALGEFDTLAIDEAFEQLEGITLETEEQQQLFEQLSEAKDIYDLDACEEIIQKWKEIM